MIHAPLPASEEAKDHHSELNLLKKHFGVSVILPKTLANDPKALEINKLEQVVRKYRSAPPASP
jgi:hypothetical protein